MPGNGESIQGAAEAVKGIVEAVPVYQDVAQPAAREVGQALLTVAKTIHIVLAPVSALVWGFEQIKEFVSTKVAEKLSDTPQEDIIEPKPHVAGPALEALRYTGHEESLRELYANLLAASLDARTTALAHPSFVEIIKQLTPDEAKLLSWMHTQPGLPLVSILLGWDDRSKGRSTLLKNFSLFGEKAGCEHKDLLPSYLDNLGRLGIIKVKEEAYYTADGAYDELLNHPTIVETLRQLDAIDGRKSHINKQLVEITPLGAQFVRACVVDHREITQVP